MDRSDIQFLGNAVNKNEPFPTGGVNGRPKLGLMQPCQDTLLEDSQIQKQILFDSFEDDATLGRPRGLPAQDNQQINELKDWTIVDDQTYVPSQPSWPQPSNQNQAQLAPKQKYEPTTKPIQNRFFPRPVPTANANHHQNVGAWPNPMEVNVLQTAFNQRQTHPLNPQNPYQETVFRNTPGAQQPLVFHQNPGVVPKRFQ